MISATEISIIQSRLYFKRSYLYFSIVVARKFLRDGQYFSIFNVVVNEGAMEISISMMKSLILIHQLHIPHEACTFRTFPFGVWLPRVTYGGAIENNKRGPRLALIRFDYCLKFVKHASSVSILNFNMFHVAAVIRYDSFFNGLILVFRQMI